ncbi:unnamed protein product [Durusdinium trenchii]|uniref:Uncharacterized protein n=1 Tax=Durusdinium trenchii TaxID=1381693 RepID=A0ABP0NWN7_9DINO
MEAGAAKGEDETRRVGTGTHRGGTAGGGGKWWVQGRLPRLNKMRITLADERWSSPNRQWLTKKGRRRLEPIVSDDTGLGEAQEILAKDLMRELMAPRSVGRLAGADLSRHTR